MDTALSLQGRALHYVLRTGNRTAAFQFFKDILGMQVLRHEEFAEGCEATCNGKYATRWSKTMFGYGIEDTHFAIELTYNYGVKSYEMGNDFIGITIQSKEAIDRAKAMNYPMTKSSSMIVLESPGGYKFYLINEKMPHDKDPIRKVCLPCSNLERTLNYWNGIIGIPIVRKTNKSVSFSFKDHQCILEFQESGKVINHAKAYGRIAFSVPKSSLHHIQSKMQAENQKIITPIVDLATPGKPDVTVIILADPDDYEICFVGDEAFRELSQYDPKAEAAMMKFIRVDKS